MGKTKLMSIFVIMLIALFAIPSYSLGKNTQVIRAQMFEQYGNHLLQGYVTNDGKEYKATKGQGDQDVKPPLIELNLQYDEVIIDYNSIEGEMAESFRFKLIPYNGYNIGKYMINIKTHEKQVIFTKIGMAKSSMDYSVSPYEELERGYLQAGAIYNDASSNSGYSIPYYKIEAMEVLSKSGWKREFYLGNSHLQMQAVASAAVTHPQCYVFTADGKEKDLYHFSSAQIGATAQFGNNAYKIEGTQKAGDFAPR